MNIPSLREVADIAVAKNVSAAQPLPECAG